MDSNIAICASGLTKSFGNIIEVDHIDFEIRRGIFGSPGPNSAGKTTTIRMLTGLSSMRLSRSAEGKGSILGLDINFEIVKIKRHIGVVPEI